MKKNGNKLGQRSQAELMGSTQPTGQPSPAITQGIHGITTEQFTIQQGPIPPPDMLAAYESTHPGLAERLVAMAEAQSRHRQELEKASAKMVSDDAIASRLERRRGQVIGGITVIIAICAAVAVGVWGNGPWANAASAAIGGIPLVGLVLVFMTGKKGSNGQSRSE
jgi:uncharacterized membrane protein